MDDVDDFGMYVTILSTTPITQGIKMGGDLRLGVLAGGVVRNWQFITVLDGEIFGWCCSDASLQS